MPANSLRENPEVHMRCVYVCMCVCVYVFVCARAYVCMARYTKEQELAARDSVGPALLIHINIHSEKERIEGSAAPEKRG
jgi:hypothetical protein